MKKLIAYLIIYGLVLQLFNGCQSARNISKEELRNFNQDNDVIITTIGDKEYTLRRDSSYQYFSDWSFVDDKIELTETKVIQYEDRNSRELTTIKTEINENDLADIGVMEFDGLKTTLFIVGILAIVIGIGLLTYEGPDFSGMTF
jgi:hypothetical protein